jgi:hypothetical protein
VCLTANLVAFCANDQMICISKRFRVQLIVANQRVRCDKDQGHTLIGNRSQHDMTRALSRLRFRVGPENGVGYRKPVRPEGGFVFSVPNSLPALPNLDHGLSARMFAEAVPEPLAFPGVEHRPVGSYRRLSGSIAPNFPDHSDRVSLLSTVPGSRRTSGRPGAQSAYSSTHQSDAGTTVSVQEACCSGMHDCGTGSQ